VHRALSERDARPRSVQLDELAARQRTQNRLLIAIASLLALTVLLLLLAALG
jgi:hypothetical protein